jgi:hypothetical protein
VNYREDMSRCIDYIEEHIKENITAAAIILYPQTFINPCNQEFYYTFRKIQNVK